MRKAYLLFFTLGALSLLVLSGSLYSPLSSLLGYSPVPPFPLLVGFILAFFLVFLVLLYLSSRGPDPVSSPVLSPRLYPVPDPVSDSRSDLWIIGPSAQGFLDQLPLPQLSFLKVVGSSRLSVQPDLRWTGIYREYRESLKTDSGEVRPWKPPPFSLCYRETKFLIQNYFGAGIDPSSTRNLVPRLSYPYKWHCSGSLIPLQLAIPRMFPSTSSGLSLPLLKMSQEKFLMYGLDKLAPGMVIKVEDLLQSELRVFLEYINRLPIYLHEYKDSQYSSDLRRDVVQSFFKRSTDPKDENFNPALQIALSIEEDLSSKSCKTFKLSKFMTQQGLKGYKAKLNRILERLSSDFEIHTCDVLVIEDSLPSKVLQALVLPKDLFQTS